MAENVSGVPKICKTVSENTFEDDVLEILKTVRPRWTKNDIKFKTFTGGCTNKLIGCWSDDDESDCVLLRIFGMKTELFIDREMEQRCMQLLAPLGCAPQVYAMFNNGLCYKFLAGCDLDVHTVRDENISSLIAEKMVKMHNAQTGSWPKSPCVFHMIRKFHSLIPENYIDIDNNQGSQHDIPTKDELAKEIDILESHLPSLGSPVVFCHNDLLVKNLIYEESSDTITFIDFEYAGYNYQAFDIANHFCEFAGMETVDYSLYPDKAFQTKWLETYLTYWFASKGKGDLPVTEDQIEDLYIQVNKFALAAHLLWGLWALVQAVHSTINFDFLDYAGIRLKEYFKRKEEFLEMKRPLSAKSLITYTTNHVKPC